VFEVVREISREEPPVTLDKAAVEVGLWVTETAGWTVAVVDTALD
jgi:hypothetical protein